MTSSDILTLIGLSLATLGAILLAYDVVYGPGKRFQAGNLAKQLRNLRSTRRFVQGSIKASKGFTPQEIQKQLDEEEQKNGAAERELVEQNEKFLNNYELRVTMLGAYGVLLIVAGFVLQIVGLLIHPSEKKTIVVENPTISLQISQPRCIRPFDPGEDTGVQAEKAVKLLAYNLAFEMSREKLLSLVLVGSVDKQQLRKGLKTKFGSNRGLAKARATWVESKLRSLLPSMPSNVVILTAGPTIEATTPQAKEQDRYVAIYSIWDQTLNPEFLGADQAEPQFVCRP